MISKIDQLISKLASTKTAENLFNPYNQICKNHDISTAPGLRQGNLRLYLEAHLRVKTEVLLVHDTVDYFSSKISGVPFVEINNYAKVEKILKLEDHFERANKNGINGGTNTLITKVWDLIESQAIPSIIWNLLPFYAHSPSDISTKRHPSQDEFEEHKEFINLLIEIYKPKTIYAITPNTKNTLTNLGIKSKLLNI